MPSNCSKRTRSSPASRNQFGNSAFMRADANPSGMAAVCAPASPEDKPRAMHSPRHIRSFTFATLLKTYRHESRAHEYRYELALAGRPIGWRVSDNEAMKYVAAILLLSAITAAEEVHKPSCNAANQGRFWPEAANA